MAERDVYLQGLIADQVLGQERSLQANEQLVAEQAAQDGDLSRFNEGKPPIRGAFESGLRSGANNFSANIEYFKALGNTLVGDEYGAERNLRRARTREQMAARSVQGFETFEQFKDEPTFGGFVDQALLATGQMTPYAAETIATGLIGYFTGGAGLAAIAGKEAIKQGMSEGATAVTKRLVKDLVSKKARGEQLDMFEEEAADAVYQAFRAGSKRGTVLGAAAGTYPLNTGESFGEFDDAGVDMSAERALQSLMIGAGSTAIEIGSEAFVFGKLAALAKSKSSADSDLLSIYAKNLGTGVGLGTVTEGTTEVAQEGLLVGQRLSVDENYTQDDVNLRLGQAFFQGAVGGGSFGGGGATLATAPEAVNRIFGKAQELSRMGRNMELDDSITTEQYGGLDTLYTTPESQADINAQLDAMQDDGYGKQAVWVAGENAAGADAPEQGRVKRNGQDVYYAFIKGRGTIFSPDAKVVNDVITQNASDVSLARALGYSAPKSTSDNLTRVVQVRDENNNVVSEELTTDEGLIQATEAADALAGSKGRVSTTTLESAQEERAKRFRAEQSRQMIIDEDALPENDPDATEEMDQGLTELDLEDTALGEDLKPYAPRATRDTLYENTEQLRKEYESVFGPTDWARSPLGLASDAALKKAIELQGRNPQTAVTLFMDGDGNFVIEGNQLDGSLYTIQDADGNQRRLPLGEFIVESIQKMTRRSRFSRPQKDKQGNDLPFVTLKNKEGKSKGVNIADLIATGKRINQTESGGSFEGGQADTDGLSTILGALAEQGYTLEIDGQALQGDDLRSIPDSYRKVTVDNKGKTLYDVLTRTTSRATPLTAGQQEQLNNYERFIDEQIENDLEYKRLYRDFTPQELDARRRELEAVKADRMKDFEINMGFARDEVTDTASTASAAQRNVPAVQGEDGAGGGRPNEEFQRGSGPVFAEGRAGLKSRVIGVGGGERIQTNAPAPEGEIDLAQLGRQEGFNADRLLEMGDNNPGTSTRRPVLPDPDEAARVEVKTVLKGAAEIFGSLPETAEGLLSTMLRKLRLDGKVVVVTKKALEEAQLGYQQFYFNNEVMANGEVNPVVAALLQDALEMAVPGMYVPLPQQDGPTAHLIVIDDGVYTTGNEAEIALSLAHEVGHAVFKEEMGKALNNRELRSRLMRDFRKALEKNPELYEGYDEDVQFEEWVADQVAKWGASELKARGIVQRFFKALADKLRSLWGSIDPQFKKRFGQEESKAFRDYAREVIRRKDEETRTSGPRRRPDSAFDASTQSMDDAIRQWQAMNAPVRLMRNAALDEAVKRAINEKFAQYEQETFQRNTRLAWEGLLKAVLPAQQRLRRLGAKTGAGIRIAKMMYGRAGEQGMGFVQRTTLALNQFQSRLEDLFGGNLDYLSSQAFKDAAAEAASSTPTLELTNPDAIKIRVFLEEIYDDYIAKEPNTKIGRQDNYFPVMLNLDIIEQNIDEFAADIARERGDLTPDQVKETMVKAINRSRGERPANESLERGVDPLHTAEEALELTKGVSRDTLAKYSKPPEEVVVQYIRRTVKRVEWNRATKGGDTTLNQELAQLSEKEREEAYRTMGALLGFYVPMDERFRVASSLAQNVQIWTTLGLATLSSIPELATAVIATREFSGVMGGFREIINTIANPRERYEFARELGVIANDSMANAFMSEADLQYMDEKNRKVADFFFKYTGLEIFTRFTRVFAAGMAEKFIVSHAMNPRDRSDRYLSELGLNQDIVKQWVKSGKGFDTPAGELVKQGLQKFVESTMLRPNAAERPVWASDPRYAILWQLKSFPYSYGQVVIGGAFRELKARQMEGRAAGKTGGQIVTQDLLPHLALFGLAVLPFAMMSLELKELTKYSMGAILPFAEADARVFKTDDMDWTDYFLTAYGAAGVFGPLALLSSAQTDMKWGKPPVSVFGPTVDTLYQVFMKGDVQRMIPIYNQFG